MERNIYISEFESESQLKDENAYSLPSFGIFAGQNRLLLGGMDALTVTMADEGDLVVTSRELPAAYVSYWDENICAVDSYTPATELRQEGATGSVYCRLMRDENARSILKSGVIVNYALVPGYYEMCREFGIDVEEPGIELIRELNSKAYSNELKQKLGLPAAGMRVRSVDEYAVQSTRMIREYGRVLIKDVMGVSGRGMLLIDSETMALRLSEHFRKQEVQGRTGFDFILEPVLDRKTDFSCLFQVDESGTILINGYRKNESRGYSYLGSGPLNDDETELIASSEYAEQVMAVAGDMASRGYRGFACIDSMITKDDEVIPLLEINPRMSMSRFSLMLEQRLGSACRLGYTEGKSAGRESTEHLLEALDAKAVLYTAERGCGIIPMAPRTWDAPEAAGRRVRIYYAVIYRSQEEYEKILAAWVAHCSGSICAGPVSEKTN